MSKQSKKTTKSRAKYRLESFYKTPKHLLYKRESFDLLPKVRENVTKLYESDNTLCDECDYNRILSNDWSVQRYLEYYGNDVDKATDQLVDTLKWRKGFGINERTLEKDCAKEMFQLGGLFVYNEDKNGIPLLFMRAKCNRRVPRLRPLVEMYLVGMVEHLDTQVDNKGFVLILDLSESGFHNLDLDLLNFLIKCLTNRYPLAFQYVIAYNLPFLLRGFWQLVKGWLGDYKHLVMFANSTQDLMKYIDIEALPKYIGGKCAVSFTEAPDNCPTVHDLAEKYGFSESEVKKYMKVYEDLLEESIHLYD